MSDDLKKELIEEFFEKLDGKTTITIEELDKMSEELEEVENADKTKAEMEAASKVSTGVLPEKYKRIDYRI